MKYCPQCKRQFTEPWLSFCSDDGIPLIEELTPAADPNWDPRIHGPRTKTASEQETQWLPRQPPMPGAWVAPDQRPPMAPGPWQPAGVPYRPYNQQPSQSLALASMIVGLCGLAFGTCFGPLPGIVALIMGLVAQSKIKNYPLEYTGKPYATAGIIIGAISTAFFTLFVLFLLFRVALG